MPTFKIEQIALNADNTDRAMQLLIDLGIASWSEDRVEAAGTVFGEQSSNAAMLRFNYTALESANELEVLEYTDGPDWLSETMQSNCVSHLGMHCSEEELDEWKALFAAREIGIAQEVHTQSHTNPVIAGKRFYHYCIFNTRELIGVDLKFIVRRDV